MILNKVAAFSSILLLILTFIPWPQFFNYYMLALISIGLWFITLPVLIINPLVSIVLACTRKNLSTPLRVYYLLTITLNIVAALFLLLLFLGAKSIGFEFAQ